MDIVIIIILFIIALAVLITLHELGHFLTAKRAGVKVEEFGLGLPPRIFSIKRGETVYSLNAIPLGAFIKTPSEDDPTVPGSLASKGPWARLGVYAAGPLANIFLAFIFLSAFFTLPTSVVVGNGIMVHTVVEDSPAEKADIEPGDIILEVNGQPLSKWGDLQNMVNSSKEGEELTLLVQRDGSRHEVNLKPEFDPALQRRVIGVLLCWNIVREVKEGSPADLAGIRQGDTVLGINGQSIYNNESMSRALNSVKEGEEIQLVLLRGKETVSTTISSQMTDNGYQLGIELHWVEDVHIEQEQFPVWKAAYLGGSYIVNFPALVINSIPLIKEDPGKALVGPIGAGQLTVEAVRLFGFSNVLLMAGVISLCLALFNFFPIPPLDGGGMLVALIEGIRRGKRLPPRMVKLAYTIGTFLLIALMVLVTFKDILRLIRGESFM
mgnify:CR=1 FL=1